MDFTSEITDSSLLESTKLMGPTTTTTNVYNGNSKHNEDNISQENFSSDLSRLDFEAMLNDDGQSPLSSSQINQKSKSNPLLDQLLDKPMDSGELGIFGYSGNYGDASPPEEPAQSFITEEQNSFFDMCMETPYPLSKAHCGPDGASDPDEDIEQEDNKNGEKDLENEDKDSENSDEDDGEDDDEDNEEKEEGEDEGDGEDGEDYDGQEEEEEEEKESSDNEAEAKENGDEEDKLSETIETSGDVQLKSEDKKRKTRQKTTSKSNESSENDVKDKKGQSDNGKGKRKRKGVKRKSDKSPGKDEKNKKSKRYMMRKNIKKIISDGDVNAKTLKAQAEEAERLRRVEERAALMKQQNQHLLQNSQEDVMILSSDEEITPCHSGYGLKNNGSDADVIEIASGDDSFSDDDQFPPNDYNNSTISVCSSSGGRSAKRDSHRRRKQGGEDVEYIDTNNDGAHTDDRFNQPDEEGRVLVNVGHPAEEEPIYLASQLGKAVKPHQIGGIRFLYDNIIDSLRRHRTSDGIGCILAHSMGLGKTLQLISFIDIYLTHTQSKHVLCIVPINTLQNWMSEFDMWLPSKKVSAFKLDSDAIKFRQFDVFMLNECKTLTSRAKEILAWRKAGGVLLIGYEMYRLLTTDGKTARGKTKAKTKEIEDLPQEVYDNYMRQLQEALVDPGPDLVICDEGHRIKNCNAATSLALKNIRTRRRVVLTGYPLQNNLIEYWCMVDFVRPNFLGTKQEFCNMFERPISNGQCADSTAEDKRVMKQRAHVLHKLLRGFVQRRSHSILTKSLPRKHEHVILVRMTPIQQELMLAFLERIKSDKDNAHRLNPIMLFSVFCKVWNHPDILYKIVKEGQNFDDLDIDLGGEKTKAVKKAPNKKKGKAVKTNKRASKNLPINYSDDEDDSSSVSKEKPKNVGNKNGSAFQASDVFTSASNDYLEGDYTNQLDGPSSSSVTVPSLPGQYPNRMMDYTWAEPLVANYKPGLLQNGLKMLLFFEMVEQTLLKGDKLLVFSHSLFTLDIIEKFLSQRKVPKVRKDNDSGSDSDDDEPEKWCKGANYFRIDGSTSSSEREKLINTFNKNKNVHLFLLSTRAGCLGINLIGANRIIVFDASWNPCHDAQAACRIYRYGQQKECFIYRLICDESLEKRIYDRQITKQEVSCRVVDELNPETNFTRREIDSLMEDLDSINLSEVKHYTQDECDAYEDDLIRHICKNLSYCLSKPPFEHESLLLDHKESKLSYEEKKAAEDMYMRQKHEMSKSSVNGAKHSNYLASMTAAMTNTNNNTFPNVQIAGPQIDLAGINIPSIRMMTPQKPSLGRPSKYPSVGMLPPSALKPGTYTPFTNSVWNNSLVQSRNLTGHQYFQQNQLLQQQQQQQLNPMYQHVQQTPQNTVYQQQPQPQSSQNPLYQQQQQSSSSNKTNFTLRFPPILSRNSIINQYNNLPPDAFVEQLVRNGYEVKTLPSDKQLVIPPSPGRDQIVVPQGQNIMFIRSPKNECYLRTIEGRMFSLKPNEMNCGDSMPMQSTPLPSNMHSNNSRIVPSTSTSQPEIIFLDDDD
ncbi:helicase ARIP4-like isoform X2 [Panonychus citri]|uniref:helicase ARIP4-like isoform X2 n=1 Tax=Panonychus citri TaxID=50023 RepID=UPI002307AA31|nr:helicase ARIP4-like isoform X2 [Panonychus citri]